MLLTIIKRSFLNQKKAVAVMVVSVAVGTAIAASLLSLSFDISTKVSKELRSFGANILVIPRVSKVAGIAGESRYLLEEDIVKVKTIFWRHNILAVVPFLYVKDPESGLMVAGTWYKKTLKVPGERNGFVTGVSTMMPWWDIQGNWPETEDEVLVGSAMAEERGIKVGDILRLFGRELRVSGIVRTGGREEEMVITELSTLQKITGLRGKFSRLYVSALTTPMDDFAYKDPEKMTRKEYEKWYCTGYVTSIAKQIEEVIRGSKAKPIWPVAETEGRILKRLSLLIYLLTAFSLLASALGVSTTMIMSLLRRTDEVALMKSLGADRLMTVTIFLSEALIIGFVGGLVGYLCSFFISGYIGYQVFGTALTQKTVLLPMSVGASVIIAVLGVYLPIRRAFQIRPAVVLRGE